MDNSIHLKTVGYIDLESNKPKVYKNKGNLKLVKDTRHAAQQVRQDKIEAERKAKYAEQVAAWEKRVKMQHESALVNRLGQLKQTFNSK